VGVVDLGEVVGGARAVRGGELLGGVADGVVDQTQLRVGVARDGRGVDGADAARADDGDPHHGGGSSRGQSVVEGKLIDACTGRSTWGQRLVTTLFRV